MVLEALESLHQELDKIKPAIRQVEVAEQVIAEARKIPEQYLNLVAQLEGQEAQFKQKLVGDLSGHTDQIRREVNSLVKDAGVTITNLTKHEAQFGAIQQRMTPLVDQLSALQMKPRFDELQGVVNKRFDQLGSDTELVLTGVKAIQDRLNTSEVTLGNRLTEEGKARRDQLDRNTTAIKLEVRQLTDSIKAFETSLGDQLSDYGKKQIEQVDTVYKEISGQIGQVSAQIDLLQQQHRSQKTFTYITWALVALVAGIVLSMRFI